MTLKEVIEALQQNKEQAKLLLEQLQETNKERDRLLIELDEIRTKEYNKGYGVIWVNKNKENDSE